MPILAFDIHDAGIRVARPGADETLRVDGSSRCSPGIAIVSGGSVTTGMEAERRVCFAPSAVRDQFWHTLSADRLDAKDARLGNHAELARTHLQRICEALLESGDQAVFAVSAGYTPKQLGVIVAIARDLGVALGGLVPRPLACDAQAVQGERFLFLDLGLHGSVSSVVEAVASEDGEPCLAMGESQVCPEVGIRALRRRWVKAIGGEFLRTSRFDPLHDAGTEQQLHEIVQAMADSVGPADAEPLELRVEGRSHQVTVTQRLLADATQDLIRTLTAHVRSAIKATPVREIVIGGGPGRVPGLELALSHQTDTPIRWLDPGASAMELARLWPQDFERAPEPGVPFHTWRREPLAPRPEPAE